MLMRDNQLLQESPAKTGGRSAERGATVAVCFSSYDKRIACGEIHGPCLEKAIPFWGIDQLLLILEAILDALGYPPENSPRQGPANPFVDLSDEMRPADSCRQRELPPSPAFCLIRVMYRQHSSIQGIIKAGGSSRSFRSGLELAALLHEYLAEQIAAGGRLRCCL